MPTSRKRRRRHVETPTAATRNSRFDLFIPVPNKSASTSGGKGEVQIIIRNIVDRLVDTGYIHMALAHTVYGRPHEERDRASVALPSSLWTLWEEYVATRVEKPIAKSFKLDEKNSNQQPAPKIQVLRRLHAVIENVSDVAYYSATNNGPSESLLQEYDVVSLCPRNDATFQAICSTPTLAQIITLDYTAGRGGVQLPYRIRPPDVLVAVQNSMVWEIPYSPAILDVDKRKALVKTCREIQMALNNVPKRNHRILLSSGDRTQKNRLDGDVGEMALRTPDDLINVLQTVCRFDAKISRDAVGEVGTFVLNQAQAKLRPNNSTKQKISRLYYEEDHVSESARDEALNPKPNEDGNDEHRQQQPGDQDADDGFIKL